MFIKFQVETLFYTKEKINHFISSALNFIENVFSYFNCYLLGYFEEKKVLCLSWHTFGKVSGGEMSGLRNVCLWNVQVPRRRVVNHHIQCTSSSGLNVIGDGIARQKEVNGEKYVKFSTECAEETNDLETGEEQWGIRNKRCMYIIRQLWVKKASSVSSCFEVETSLMRCFWVSMCIYGLLRIKL